MARLLSDLPHAIARLRKNSSTFQLTSIGIAV
jgi:hypothetical protein